MAIRTTSIEVYKFLEENGTLSAKRWEVYATVFNNGPMTSAEAFAKINEGKSIKSLTQSRARFTELRGMELLKEVGEKVCNVTGHNVILWDVTDTLPLKLVKPETRSSRTLKIVNELNSISLLITDIFERQNVQSKIDSLIDKINLL